MASRSDEKTRSRKEMRDTGERAAERGRIGQKRVVSLLTEALLAVTETGDDREGRDILP